MRSLFALLALASGCKAARDMEAGWADASVRGDAVGRPDGNGSELQPCTMPPPCTGVECPTIIDDGTELGRWFRWVEADEEEVVFSQWSEIYRWTAATGMETLADPALPSGTLMSNLALGVDDVFRTEDDRLVAYSKADGTSRTVVSGLVFDDGLTGSDMNTVWMSQDLRSVYVFPIDGSASVIDISTGALTPLLAPGSMSSPSGVTHHGTRTWVAVTESGFVYTTSAGAIAEVDGLANRVLVPPQAFAGPTLAATSDALYWVLGLIRSRGQVRYAAIAS